MPDSLNITHPTPLPVHSPQELTTHTPDPVADFTEQAAKQAQEDLLQQVLATHRNSAPSVQATNRQPQKAPLSEEQVTDTSSPEFILKDQHEVHKGFTLEKPSTTHTPAAAPASAHEADSTSWTILGLILLFLLIAFRMRRNFKYLKGLMHKTVNSRARHNMFEDTMRETTFSLLLNVLSISCTGLLLATGVEFYRTGTVPASGQFPTGLWICLAISAGYYLLQIFAYLIIGRVFTTHTGAGMWIQGFRAGSGLLGLALFPIALLSLFYPESTFWLLLVACILYFSSRLLFIFKGIRIFSAHRTYYILFLYYLCTVEIVPVLLIWQLACKWG